jgi:hypothetical protein
MVGKLLLVLFLFLSKVTDFLAGQEAKLFPCKIKIKSNKCGLSAKLLFLKWMLPPLAGQEVKLFLSKKEC